METAQPHWIVCHSAEWVGVSGGGDASTFSTCRDDPSHDSIAFGFAAHRSLAAAKRGNNCQRWPVLFLLWSHQTATRNASIWGKHWHMPEQHSCPPPGFHAMHSSAGPAQVCRFSSGYAVLRAAEPAHEFGTIKCPFRQPDRPQVEPLAASKFWLGRQSSCFVSFGRDGRHRRRGEGLCRFKSNSHTPACFSRHQGQKAPFLRDIYVVGRCMVPPDTTLTSQRAVLIVR